jgi:hypothetical protein
MIQANVRKKIEELIERSAQIADTDMMQRDNQWIASCQSWKVEALNIIQLAIPVESNPYRDIIKDAAGNVRGMPEQIRTAGVAMKAMLSDLDAGVIADFGNTIRAETLDDLLDQAKEYHRRNNKEGAGILATAVFEDTVRRLARINQTDEPGVKTDQIISELSKRQVITGILAKRCRVAAGVRNHALHAQWTEFSLEDVEDVMRLTHQLLIEHLSGG